MENKCESKTGNGLIFALWTNYFAALLIKENNKKGGGKVINYINVQTFIGRDKNQDIYILSLEIKQESREIISIFPLRFKNQEIWLIKIPFRERIKIFSDQLLGGEQESRNKIQGFKRRIKNHDNTLLENPYDNSY